MNKAGVSLLFFLVLFFSVPAYSIDYNKYFKSGFALSAGANVIASEPGYLLRLTSPHFIGKEVALQFQFGQQLFSGFKSSSGSYEDQTYFLLEPASVMRYPLLTYLRPYILLGLPIYTGKDVSNEGGMGSHLALGAEFLKSPDSSFLLFGEMGYYLLFVGKADQYTGSPHFGQGVVFTIGIKAYLY